jgi:hypothetical protein
MIARWLCALSLFALAGQARALDRSQLVVDARAQIGVTLSYDPSYQKLAYPGGDVPVDRGVCTDVLIRALRAQGIDLQVLIHQDKSANPTRYPKRWQNHRADRNIDHRRVPNIEALFRAQGAALTISEDPSQFQAGDVVTWMLPGNLPHIGIVSDAKTEHGVPLILHNIGRGTQEEYILFEYPITGHFRL